MALLTRLLIVEGGKGLEIAKSILRDTGAHTCTTCFIIKGNVFCPHSILIHVFRLVLTINSAEGAGKIRAKTETGCKCVQMLKLRWESSYCGLHRGNQWDIISHVTLMQLTMCRRFGLKLCLQECRL
jgi:hypothetical protein